MNESQKTTIEMVPPNPIRVETALSRFPVHRLAKHGDIAIDIREKNDNGEVSIKWEVTHNSKYGQPGPLAYKLDTLLINRRIEEATRPIPKIIRLGSLREITQELGISTHATDTIRKSLRQNAGALISTKTRYRKTDGSERTLEADFTRYSVILTGEELPDGRKADAVYIVINDIYMQVINGAMTRPLDYSYLKSLPPAPQRFYELLSYQMYATIKNDRARAKLVYSELCRYAPLTRHADWERARKQIAKIHAPHKASGYIAKVDFEQTVDADGIPDWIMLYQPGPKARAEYRAFTKKGGPVMLEMEPFGTTSPPQIATPEPLPPLVAELIGHGVTDAIARQLVADYDEDKIRHQIEILGWLETKKPGKVSDSAAWLVIAIKNGHATPKGFVSAAERRKQQEVKAAQDQAAAADRRRKQEADAQERRAMELVNGFWDGLSKEQKAEHDAAAIAQATADELKLIEAGPMKKFGMTVIRNNYARKLLQSQGKLPPVEA